LPNNESAFPVQVIAARIERAPREVEVVLVEALREILGGRADRDQVAGAPWPPQRNCGLAEEQVDVDRQVRLALAALPGVSNEPNDRAVPSGECRLVGAVGRRDR